MPAAGRGAVRGGRAKTAAGVAIVATVAAVCFGSLPWSMDAMRSQDFDAIRHPPSWQYPLGTDELGRSLMARTLYGGALSLALGVLAAFVAVVVGTAYGCVAGYRGGRLDAWLMRVVDIIYGLPYMLLVMLLTLSVGQLLQQWPPLGAEGARLVVLALAIGGVSWLTVARVVRGEVLTLRERAFVDAARVVGVSRTRIIVRHLLPNLAGPVLVFATLTVPQAILQESFLSFLGVGVQPPQSTWGSLAAEGVRQVNPVAFDWWRIAAPCGALAVTLLALHFLGDGLRERLAAGEAPGRGVRGRRTAKSAGVGGNG